MALNSRYSEVMIHSDLISLQKDIKGLAKKERAKTNEWFFKTGPGQYGEGDQFIGLTMPECRKLAKKYKALSLMEVEQLLESPIHEERTLGLLLLVLKYKDHKEEIAQFYLAHLKGVNNWDLVDGSAPYILGDYFLHRDKSLLYEFAKSDDLWLKRIAMLSTFGFIKKGEYKDALAIGEILLNDTHDLIHKAVGWMLREIGKKNLEVEEDFLKKHYKSMPRTMLRYAIEKFEEKKRQAYLKGTM